MEFPFIPGSRRWWNLADSLSLSMMIIALVDGSRALGNLSSMIRVGRVLRLARWDSFFFARSLSIEET